MKNIRHFQTSLVWVALTWVALAGCSKPQSDGARLRIQFPESTSSELQDPKTSAVSVSNLCFAVNVMADDIPNASSGPCDISHGIMGGSVPPGGELALAIPRGQKRRLDVYAYQRSNSNETCPTVEAGFAKLDAKKITRIGQVTDFSTLEAEVTVSVTITLPDGTSNLITQAGLPSTCTTTTAPIQNHSAPMFSSPLQTGIGTGGYTVRSSVGAPVGIHTATGTGGWKVKLYQKGVPQ